ncbi:MAG: sulfurtransferase TusA family protein [Actinomycetes bacterium]
MNKPVTIDERGRRCPLPVISLGRVATGLPDGSQITVLADDPAAGQDIAAWCRMRGARYLGSATASDGRGLAHSVRLGTQDDA